MSDTFTLEQLSVIVNEQASLIEGLQNDVSALKLKLDASEIKASVSPVKPTIPGKNVTVDGKEYKWQKSQFKILGDATLYRADEAQHDEALLKNIIAIPGQKILQEQV
jgi:hypothetical protein